jgi:alkaline phosphatase D
MQAEPGVHHSRVPDSRPVAVSRRAFLRGAAVAALAGCVANTRPQWAGRDPFSLGVAAGEPTPDGFVLWTRRALVPLSPDPAAPGGLTPGDVPLTYEIATDPGLRTIVQQGPALAEAAFAHSVHLEVRGLAPARPYWADVPLSASGMSLIFAA